MLKLLFRFIGARGKAEDSSDIVMPHLMHDMRTIAIDDPGRPSVFPPVARLHAASLCKHN